MINIGPIAPLFSFLKGYDCLLNDGRSVEKSHGTTREKINHAHKVHRMSNLRPVAYSY